MSDLKTIQLTAKRIANLITRIDTDYRGNLLEEVSKALYRNAQNYSGNAILTAAEEYGINPEPPK